MSLNLSTYSPSSPSPSPSPSSPPSSPSTELFVRALYETASDNRNSSSLKIAVPVDPSLTPELTNIPDRILNILRPTYNARFPNPGPKSSDPTKAILWRGLSSSKQFLGMMEHQTAGGKPANSDTGRPAETRAVGQVAEIDRLPEFTFDPSIAERFGRGSLVAAFEIDIKYLTRGSDAENGVVCNPDAPITLLAWKKGQPPLSSTLIQRTHTSSFSQSHSSAASASKSQSFSRSPSPSTPLSQSPAPQSPMPPSQSPAPQSQSPTPQSPAPSPAGNSTSNSVAVDA